MKVPPAFIASLNTHVGVLVEWFVDDTQRVISGFDILADRIEDYYSDKKRGKKHNWQSIEEAINFKYKKNAKQILLDLFSTLVFDALIGNTDRHHENWQIIRNINSFLRIQYSLAPAYDNGTSLGNKLDQNKVVKELADNESLMRFIERGEHHMKLELEGERLNHIDMIIELSKQDTRYLRKAKELINFDLYDVKEVLEYLKEYNKPNMLSLTSERANFMLELIRVRQDRMKTRLGELDGK